MGKLTDGRHNLKACPSAGMDQALEKKEKKKKNKEPELISDKRRKMSRKITSTGMRMKVCVCVGVLSPVICHQAAIRLSPVIGQSSPFAGHWSCLSLSPLQHCFSVD